MRNAIAATLAVAAVLVAVNMLGVAAAEAPTTTTPVRTVSVDGVATLPIAQGASLAVATNVYREAAAAALGDGKGKAEFLSGKAGATLGTVQSIVEGGGSISCSGGEEPAYVEYEGEQPDFGDGATQPVTPAVAPRVDAGVAKPQTRKPAHRRHRKKKPRKPAAKAATTTSCTLSANVMLVYAID